MLALSALGCCRRRRIHLAVAASCAVPGYFSPVEIAGRGYVDGGAHSPTNAAVLRERELDLVIVVWPMSGPTGVVGGVYAAVRRHAARVVRREVQALRRAGIDVVVFRPGAEEQRVMGNDFMAGGRVEDIVQHSFLAAGAHAARKEVRTLLRVLSADGHR